jgi:hypothetical protein
LWLADVFGQGLKKRVYFGGKIVLVAAACVRVHLKIAVYIVSSRHYRAICRENAFVAASAFDDLMLAKALGMVCKNGRSVAQFVSSAPDFDCVHGVSP